jgi:hypothetical protein
MLFHDLATISGNFGASPLDRLREALLRLFQRAGTNVPAMGAFSWALEAAQAARGSAVALNDGAQHSRAGASCCKEKIVVDKAPRLVLPPPSHHGGWCLPP